MGRRLFLTASLALLPFAAPASAAPTQSASWAAPAIRVVSAAGLMGGAKNVTAFRASDPLAAQDLENLVFDLKARLAPPPVEDPEPAPPPATTTDPVTTTVTTTTTTTTAMTPATPRQVADPDRPVQMWQLDARLVSALGLGDAAASFTKAARAAGLTVPSRFGTEVVARLLGLRLNHPAAEDSLELRPQDTATRAEAAYSTAQILQLSDRQVPDVEEAAQSFALPTLTDWQKRILDTAVSKIGMPYIWGGTSDDAETEFGVSSRGGYDCSGFVWRVYRLQWYAGEGTLASTLRGRTTYDMSGEVPKTQRLALVDLQPADVIFFGDKGTRSKPTQVGHMGIYLGNGWFIHSSDDGVALATLTGWYAREFAWGRRPLAEAGLSS
ncbi:MAG TPA: NlpC/P60 family protein [Gaiellaceae bacterium]